MTRRLSVLATVILLLFAVVAVQSANLQFFRSKSLAASSLNPRNEVALESAPRGEIVAADGTVLAESVPTGQGRDVYRRLYPMGALTSDVVGFTSPYYGAWGLEAEYNSDLKAHAQPPQSLEQLIAPTSAADNVVLTIYPSLQRVMAKALAGRNGAAVALDPQNGDILGLYSNPNYNPASLTTTNYKVAEAAWRAVNKEDPEGFPPLGVVATEQSFPPGSTSKVVTTSAVVVSNPAILSQVFPTLRTTKLPDTDKTLSNFGYGSCGGTIAEMLPPSCDTGFALVGLAVGGAALSRAADSFGYNEVPPIDLPGAVASTFPQASAFTNNVPGVAYSAIGQENVRTTALENALIAGAIGNGGVMMAPHLMNYVTSPDGAVITRYRPHVWKRPLSATQAGVIVPLMVKVATSGTAYGVFPSGLDVAAKTGTAQTGLASHDTDDWLIAFAPANDPTIAVAVVVPNQAISATGALVAGPVICPVLAAALAIEAGHSAASGAATCP